MKNTVIGSGYVGLVKSACLEFRSPDFEGIREQLKQPVIMDGRDMYVPRDVREAGFEYISIGRP
jgi:UDPglucose 6-dehydrogenase